MNEPFISPAYPDSQLDQRLFANHLLRAVNRNALLEVEESISVETVPSGSVIIQESSEGDAVYLILAGSVRITSEGRGGRQETLGYLLGNDFFGEMALLQGTLRSARVSAAEETVLARIEAEAFFKLARIPEICLNIADAAMNRLRALNTSFIDEVKQSERLTMLGTMVGTIAHDYRNPIGTLKQAVYLLEQRKEDRMLLQMAGYMRHAIESMETMTNELVEFSGGRTSIDKREVRIEELFVELDHHILNHFPDHIELDIDFEYEGTFTADLHRLTRLLANLVKNAAEAMPDEGSLSLRVIKDQDHLRFEVQDTGCGIPPEYQTSIFEPFVTHGKAKGTGLGMAIAKSVVEAHEGRIWLDSEVGMGTTFYVTIPIRPA